MQSEGPRHRSRNALARVSTRFWIGVALVALSAVAGWAYLGPGRAAMDGEPMVGADMGDNNMADMGTPAIPPVYGYYANEEILFLHTEASDPEVADMLGGMMGSPVIVVPALADTPESARATVYVFANGVQPDGPRGPMGFQPDVFDSAPGDSGYSPLRSLVVVTWADADGASVVRSAEEVEAAIADGRLTVERQGVVVNMPFLSWPGGER